VGDRQNNKNPGRLSQGNDFVAEVSGQQEGDAMKKEMTGAEFMTDAEFFLLKSEIIKAQAELKRLQRLYKLQIGQSYKPF